MTIASLNDYIASAKQNVYFNKTTSRTAIASSWFSVFDEPGDPGAGTLAGTSTAAGVVPTDTTAGYPSLTAFGGGATGYLGRAMMSNTVACRMALFDRIFVAGAYNFNAAVTLSAQPSFTGRIPASMGNGVGLELWVEAVGASTGNLAVNVTYTNQAGTTTQTTGAVGIGAATTTGRCWQLPLAAGDSGITSVNVVTATVASAGTAVFNVMVLRRLFSGRIQVINGGFDAPKDMLATGLQQVYATSALYMLIAPDSTATGVPDCTFEVANN